MSVSQIQVRVRPVWRRLCPASFVLAGITALVVWVAVAGLLGRGRLETVLSAGRAMRWGEPAWMAGRSRSSRTRGPGRP